MNQLGSVQMIAFDKTGTVTKGQPAVETIRIAEGFSEAEVLEAVYAIETQSSHPLAQAITTYAESRGVNQSGYISIEETSGFGVMAEVSGAKWKIGKAGFIGEEMAAQFIKQTAPDIIRSGYTIVFVKKDDQIAGCIALKDQIRPEAKEVMEELNRLGIKTAMLTGDHEDTAQAIANEAGMTTVAAEPPDQKVKKFIRLKEEFGTIAMVGDGINDAPALKAADVGIAMGGGTDVALETADMVLMQNDLKKLVNMCRLSRKMNRIIKQNIVFSLAVICLLICANFLQVMELPFGVIGHEGSTILVILNGLRLLK